MVTLVILEEPRVKSRYKSLYGLFLLRDMCVSIYTFD